MNFTSIPAESSVFVDANIFIHHFTAEPLLSAAKS